MARRQKPPLLVAPDGQILERMPEVIDGMVWDAHLVRYVSTRCRAGCPTKDHATWGECARAADLQIDRHGLQHRNLEKRKDRTLSLYESARRQGLQPKSTNLRDVRAAFETGGVPKE